MKRIEMAKEWFLMNEINAFIENNGSSLYITAPHFVYVEVSKDEIEYRADMYQNEIDEGAIEN